GQTSSSLTGLTSGLPIELGRPTWLGHKPWQARAHETAAARAFLSAKHSQTLRRQAVQDDTRRRGVHPPVLVACPPQEFCAYPAVPLDGRPLQARGCGGVPGTACGRAPPPSASGELGGRRCPDCGGILEIVEMVLPRWLSRRRPSPRRAPNTS